MILDSENVDEEKQLKLNSLETINNEIRAIFAVNMLNEGWDVLNLFDIVRLYDTRDGKWVHDKYKPGNTTMGEAQLIGRGARYFPFQMDEIQDKYKRKFDEDVENELRIIETLHYHSFHNVKYISEIKSALTEMGILPEKYIQRDLFIKDSFKETEFWEEGVIFVNDRIQNPRTEIFSLQDAKIEEKYEYELRTGEIKEEIILDEMEKPVPSGVTRDKIEYKFIDEVIEKLRQKYSDIALLRNEKFFQVFDFDEGRAFEPDFIMILKKRNRTISIYQIFIEPKGDQFKDNQGRFESSKEGWKQKFLKKRLNLKFSLKT
ncbi:hypothetical protein COS91_00065 [Candidatus Desantisbacteria bacterium CG07_land_8_20_14_0_80_39_15]|uniref:Uncharacterized protein n=3 Tax=unclassified Candidatus Desantisiibacteriota TaxID=3106372 RepID=A0A2H9P9U8_9BACT|nr:MAG: hypothetical protein COS91_00065 [Candidatus Desantisbacteria bacterium CG07_land_8_20_14_0_80_39_15]PIZ15050.1 MAG: hypothetical protein COY51_06450 [Candidatus Desantisbacteria bacterium CG_4_10_14_0_8_um_filter_39_17]